MIFEWDDFGCNHKISDQCQSHDCRDKLDELHALNPNFKATLFAIPWEMTPELALWCHMNKSWIEVAVHGFGHKSNYECEKMTYDEMKQGLQLVWGMWPTTFTRIFRAPGWQISDDCLRYLAENDWIIADQDYNNDRRPEKARNYLHDFEAEKQGEQKFYILKDGVRHYVDAWHGHTWSVGWNGIEESFDEVKELVMKTKNFKFVSEVVDEVFRTLAK